MPGPDYVELIPRTYTRDARYERRGDVTSPVVNLRLQVRLETPGFALDLGGKELAWKVADLYRATLSANYARGLDAQGTPLPRLSAYTVKRRERRLAQYRAGADPKKTLADRFKLRGWRKGRGARPTFAPGDTTTPFHESGLQAGAVDVTYKGRDSGNPIWLVAFAGGGKARGLHTDDGRGARLFAVEHYGLNRLAGMPRAIEHEVDAILTNHLATVLQAGGSVIDLGRTLYTYAERIAGAIEEARESPE